MVIFFNTATTFQPWKRRNHLEPDASGYGASIRPRPFSRGIVRQPRAHHLTQPRASIRPRPFSRGIVLSLKKFAGNVMRLQYGHDLSAVETTGHWGIYSLRSNASIRPRPFSRGNIL